MQKIYEIAVFIKFFLTIFARGVVIFINPQQDEFEIRRNSKGHNKRLVKRLRFPQDSINIKRYKHNPCLLNMLYSISNNFYFFFVRQIENTSQINHQFQEFVEVFTNFGSFSNTGLK